MQLFLMIPLGDDYAYIKARNLECNGRKFCIDFYDITHPSCTENSIYLEIHHKEQYDDPDDPDDEPIITAGTIHL
ncbi:MAG: hypothetical protein ACRCX2_04565 [Paraclostridium sp.]